MEGLDQQQIGQVVRRFYDRVRVDEELGPVFSVVEDWDEHLVRLSEFWSSVTLMTGQYKGNPLAMHLVHIDRFKPEMFERWLTLWRATTDELLSSADASLLQAKAARIAGRFRMAMFTTFDEMSPVSHLRPYRTSCEFTDQSLPPVLHHEHRLDQETWAIVRVRTGEIQYLEGAHSKTLLIEAGTATVVPPDTPHRFEIVGPVALTFEFYDRNPASLVHLNERKIHA
ncbi:DUF1971 domain-containing protein [Rhizobium sp. Root708]|uniref:DUF1971 domain-containing protein n=1 Tax=Rhizobium sp. Root708 TaxID=1736592 RepID=UPI000B068403|nr:DUF1971 domain-containing protein [Rhizobium sp. Root708]